MRSARLVALVLALVACSPDAVEVTTTELPTTTSTTTTSTTTTTTLPTTTLPPPPTSLINGLLITDPEVLNRRVMMIKIDNHPNAQPQSGIDQADMVVELLVEGGFTRLITVWHESDSDFLGPNRSLRPTDYHLGAALHEPTVVHSGGQQWVQAQAREREINILLPDERNPGDPPATWRLPGRRSPHNLWVNSYRVREMADDRGYANEPPLEPIWEFGEMPVADSASVVRIPFSDGTRVTWTWDEETKLWLRSLNNRDSVVVDKEGETTRIGVPVLIMLYTEQYIEQAPDWAAGSSSLPASRTIGSGRALIFANGMVIEGLWERAVEEEWFRLIYAEGQTMMVPPGKVWVSLVPSDRGLTYEP